ncbi:MAG: hypothetical protein CMF52_00090 [Legionellales bacterium]|mgnify:FL=1|nr:hypothetical protein [Legionellales bacterium]|tara:strand:- start:4390 stop:4800 length:411 start_codon:yes stop_codon:yes gene_type:complete
MGNTAQTHTAYIAEVKQDKNKIYLACPDHMPILCMQLPVADAMDPSIHEIKVYRFTLPYEVPYSSLPIPRETIKRYKHDAEQVENQTGQLTERDVEIIQTKVAEFFVTVNESDSESDQSSLTKIDFDPIHPFSIYR